MTEPEQIKAVVRLVADGLLRSDGEPAIVARLVASGIPAADAPALYGAIKTACRAGVQAALTDGHSAPNGPPADPLLAEAFRVGQDSFRGAVGGVWMRRLFLVVAAAAAIGLLVWWVRG